MAIGHDLPPTHEVLSSATHCDHMCLGDISLKKGDRCERVWMLPKDLIQPVCDISFYMNL